jgi:hypothetical protein
MQRVNGIEQPKILPVAIAEVTPIRQLIKAADVARRLGVSISWVVQHASGMAELAKAEVKRLQARQKHFEATADRVSGMVLRVLDWLRVTKLEGQTNTLKKRKCPPSVNVIDEQKIPAEYKRVTVTLPLPQWQELLARTPDELRNTVLGGVRKQEIMLELDAIKQALNQEKAVEGADLALNRFKLQVI